MTDRILFENNGDIATITLNRPDVGNLMTNEMGATLAAMLDSASDSKLVVLRGAGKDFCLGRDLAPPGAGSAPTALGVRQGNTEPALKAYAAFRRNTVPVLGVVTGRAIGFGCAMAGICDLTFAAEDARFQLPEMNHGIPPCLAMSALIDRVPRKAIMDMVYSTDEFDARRALAIGLISRVVPAGNLQREVDRFISGVAGRSAATLLAVKEYMRSAPAMEPQAAADFASNLLSNVVSSRR
jgi:enoyl-CoA hydratase